MTGRCARRYVCASAGASVRVCVCEAAAVASVGREKHLAFGGTRTKEMPQKKKFIIIKKTVFVYNFKGYLFRFQGFAKRNQFRRRPVWPAGGVATTRIARRPRGHRFGFRAPRGRNAPGPAAPPPVRTPDGPRPGSEVSCPPGANRFSGALLLPWLPARRLLRSRCQTKHRTAD